MSSEIGLILKWIRNTRKMNQLSEKIYEKLRITFNLRSLENPRKIYNWKRCIEITEI